MRSERRGRSESRHGDRCDKGGGPCRRKFSGEGIKTRLSLQRLWYFGKDWMKGASVLIRVSERQKEPVNDGRWNTQSLNICTRL